MATSYDLPEAETYNGWTNRETWAASLHLSNDQALVGTVEALAAEALDEARQWMTDHPELAEICDLAKRATWIAADKLRDLVDEWAADAFQTAAGEEEPEFVGPTVAMMLDEVGSRWRVDWPAVVSSYVDELAR